VNYEDNRTHVVRASYVTPSARLDGFIVEGGHAFDEQASAGRFGAGLYCDHASPTIANTIFRNNWAGWRGGAVCSDSPADLDFRFIACTFVGNLSSEGGFPSGGGGAGAVFINTGGQTIFQDCLFEANSARGNGGAVFIASSPATFTGCTFRNNTLLLPLTDGAGMYNQLAGSSILIEGCTFESHAGSNTRRGGAVSFYSGGTATVRDTIFRQNTAQVGGGVHFDGQSGTTIATFDRCQFIQNQAQGDAGMGGVGALQITVRDSSILQNAAASSSGGLGGVKLVERCAFTGNTAGDSGGAVNTSESCIYRNCAFTNNEAAGTSSSSGGGAATGGQFFDCSFVDNAYTGQNGNGGGAANGLASTFVRCEFRGNTSNTWGGATYLGQDFVNCVFTGNSAVLGGGACFVPRRMTNCQFTGNTSVGNGGAVLSQITSNLATLRNCSLAGNSASIGGGIYLNINSGATTIENCLLWDNTQTSAGSVQNAQLFKTAATELVLNYTVIQGLSTTFGGVGNGAGNPQLLDPRGPDGIYGTSDDSLEIGTGSSCIDSGDNTRVPADAFDLDGDGNTSERTPLDFPSRPRFQDDAQTPDTGVGPAPVVDRGAWEYIQPASPPPNCYANCDGSTQAPSLTPNDFLCFLNAYSSGLAYANCDGSTVAPVLTPNDFLCFLNRYSIGCP
jgi:predicted outer membrane repeat protein